MQYSELEYWMWLTVAFGPANSRKWNTLSHYHSVAEAFDKISSGDLTRVMPQDVSSVRAAKMEKAQEIIKLCENEKIGVCYYGGENYPDRLKEIYNPPSVLFYLGDISGIDSNIVITAVGTKKPSEYSVMIAQRICTELASQGVHIASGFAVGLDSVAHHSALKAGGKTYAVLSCGILYDYPQENAPSKPIIAEHGAVISEYFPRDITTSHHYRARNRILAGISLGTLVLQAGLTSGSLSTASFALSHGRDVFCIPPHELYNNEYAGVTGLLRDGAIAVFDSDDILNEYCGLYPHKHESKPEKPGKILPTVSETNKQKSEVKNKPADEKKGTDKAIKTNVSKSIIRDENGLDFNSKNLLLIKNKIYEFIRDNGEVHLDRIIAELGDIYELESYLTELEIEGAIRSLPGNRFSV